MADKDDYSSEEETFESILRSQVLGGEIPIPAPVEPMSRIYYPSFDESQWERFMAQPRYRPDSDFQTSTEEFSDRRSPQFFHLGRGSFAHLVPCRREGGIFIGNEQNPRGMEDSPQDVHRYHQVQNPNRLSISGRDAQIRRGLQSIGRDDGMGHLAERYGENFKRNVLLRGRDEDKRQGNEFSSNRPDPLNEHLLEKNVVNVATQLLSVNDEENPHAENPNAASDFSLGDVSIEYLKLYTERSSPNYDFAMNLMAYIELLNDSSWKATVSYFDENVKRMFERIWNERQVGFADTVDLQRFNREMVLKLMLDFTQWSINRSFEMEEFLNYCVLMCQLAVIVRKNIFKEAPFYAIGQLRDRIKLLKFENFVQFLLGIAVKDHSMRLMEHSRV